ncbi:long-chain fatty acid--CoA ligase [Kineosporia sp. NBRC 101731]|uniref:long-chain-fatty-acid--CoA ligase n=1 Tax=Kineosporia sp. NBRC 101731 TaxID=3032199 RepID=UPI0024A47F23|nr:long-chain fatty acid--CoA ligase [Kineosporia sp. NBRC 101731]GLY32236.1 AMP-dependent synthetase [Kineosporia sp. NBRC 101731]
MTLDNDQHDQALTGPGHGTLSVAAILAETARRTPDRTALIIGDHSIAYGPLWDQTRAYAGALADRGVGPGTRVAMLVPNVPDFARVYYAVLSLGAVVVPVHLLFKAEEIEHVLRDSGASLLVLAAPALGEGLPAAAAAGVAVVTVLAPDGTPVARLEDEARASTPIRNYASVNPLAPATILYTSGTTGRPKGAVSSHLALVEQVHVALIDSGDVQPDDVIFGGLPFFHTFGQSSVLNIGFRRGATVLLLPRFDPDEALALMVRHGATIFTAVPTMFLGVVQAAARSSQTPPLRYAVSGGAALPVPLLEAFEKAFGASVHEGYGLTETSPTVSFNYVGEPTRPGTVGRALWGVDVEVADPGLEGEITFMDAGQLGELVVRGHNLFKGYLGNPGATASVVVDGWFRTGDLGTKDEDGVITIVDRKKDMIVRNGYNVYPREVEDVIMRHPAVAQVAVFGVPDPVHGQEVHAAVVAAPGQSLSGDDVLTFTRERIAAYKYPRIVHVRQTLPTGASGKLLKRELVAEHAPAGSASGTTSPGSPRP